MKIIGTNGREYNINFKPRTFHKFRSKLEEEVYNILKEKFPYDIIIYNWSLPGGTRCSLDFFIPRLLLAIECDGKQHNEFVKFFHGNQSHFIAQKYRDFNKNQFCVNNNITLVRIQNTKELLQYLDS